MYSPKNISPINIEPTVSIGISLPFNKRVIFTPTFFTKDSIKANIINYLLTNPGERYLNNGFGSGLRQLLFESINSESDGLLDNVKEKIRGDINKYFPNVVVDKLECNFNSETHKLFIQIYFRVTKQGERDRILLTL